MTEPLNGMIDFSGPAYSKLFRGLFDGTMVQVLNEILQNAQRAQATRVAFRFFPETGEMHISDNGNGLVSCGLSLPHDADMIALLMTTRTAHSAEVIAEQSPMGLGFLSVLAHESTLHVEVASGFAGLSIDTARWWSDFDYRDQTRARITWYRERVEGLQLVIKGWNPDLVEKELRKLVDGYRDLLDVTFDGFSVTPSSVYRPYDITVIDTGRTVTTVQPRGDGHWGSKCVINFWGQVIEMDWDLPWLGYTHIRESAPFDFVTPVRTGVIRNARWHAWVASVKQAILDRFQGAVARERRDQVTPAVFSALEAVENGWGARHGCALWVRADGKQKRYEYSPHLNEDPLLVVWADDLPTHAFPVDREVVIEELDAEGGVIEDSAVEGLTKACMRPLTDDVGLSAYYHRSGALIPAHRIVWMTTKVEIPGVNSDFYALGTWHLETPEGDRSQTFDMSGEMLFVAEDNRGDWSSGYGIIAMLEDPNDVISVLEAAAAWIAEDQDNRTSWDGEGETARLQFWQEVAITVARLRGNELPKNWNWDVLEEVAGKTAVKVEKVQEKQDMMRSWVRYTVWRVTFEDGTEKEYTE